MKKDERYFRYAGHVAHVRYDDEGKPQVIRGAKISSATRGLRTLPGSLRAVARETW